MADVLFVAIVVGFFGLMVLLVRACDAIIGPDPLELDDGAAPHTEDTEDSEVAAEVGA